MPAGFSLDQNDQFGRAVGPLGDLNNDGVPDVAIGVFSDDDGGAGRGAVYLLFLSSDGTCGSFQKLSMSYGMPAGFALDAGDNFGASVSMIGDLNGDGVADLAVGALGDDDGNLGAGAVYILRLTTSGTATSFTKLSASYGMPAVFSLEEDAQFGQSVSYVGDANGDGVADLLVGAPGDDDAAVDSGAVYLIYLTTDGRGKAYTKMSASSGMSAGFTLGAQDKFGASLASLGDLNSDGCLDLLVGAIGDDDGAAGGGAVYAVFLHDVKAIAVHVAQKRGFPTLRPTPVPTSQPTPVPSQVPTPLPTLPPSPLPSPLPSLGPTPLPTLPPSPLPTPLPTPEPTPLPTAQPTPLPTSQPTPLPSTQPTPLPTGQPTPLPSAQPTPLPTIQPTSLPTSQPTSLPSAQPIPLPTIRPTALPTAQPSSLPTRQPSPLPTAQPTGLPTAQPTPLPTSQPTPEPSPRPSPSPTPQPSSSPTLTPSPPPTLQPTPLPTAPPTPTPTPRPSPLPTTPVPTSEEFVTLSATLTVSAPSPEDLTLGVVSNALVGHLAGVDPTRPKALTIYEVNSVLGEIQVVTFEFGAVINLLGYATAAEFKAAVESAMSAGTEDGSIGAALSATCECQAALYAASFDLGAEYPTLHPTPLPTLSPSSLPTLAPTNVPSPLPSPAPSLVPTSQPTSSPTRPPTALPSLPPSPRPTGAPSHAPTASFAPTTGTKRPTLAPSPLPTLAPSPVPTFDPVPGVTVEAKSDPLVVYEAGPNSTNFFKIRLDSMPLSNVTVSFYSARSLVTIDPKRVVFTWRDWRALKRVRVAGVYDPIDQPVDHSWDQLRLEVSSPDSMPDCLASGRPNCGLGALYGAADFPLPRVNLTVVDTDKSAVLIDLLAVAAAEAGRSPLNATYDNFGDPLTAARYLVKLASEPTAPVVVTVGGLGAFAAAHPGNVTLDASNWADGVPVEILASAPTARRPVCRSGGRFCPAMVAARLLNVTHSAASSDVNYAGLAAQTFQVRASVVYDAAEPPAVAGAAQFADTLNSLAVTLDSATDLGGLRGVFPCQRLIALSTAELASLLGLGAACRWASAWKLKVVLGSGATVLPGDALPLYDLTLKAADPGASLFATNQSFTVAPPARPVSPSAALGTTC